MKIKAIYLPDLAFDSSDGSFNFVYNHNTKMFVMETDKEISYSEDSVLEDIESWLLFKTELLLDDNGIKYGKCKQIDIEEFKKLREDEQKMNIYVVYGNEMFDKEGNCSIDKEYITSNNTYSSIQLKEICAKAKDDCKRRYHNTSLYYMVATLTEFYGFNKIETSIGYEL